MQQPYKKILEIVAAGTPLTIEVYDKFQEYMLWTNGAVALLGNQAVTIGAGTPGDGSVVSIKYVPSGALTLGAQTLTVLGVSIPQAVVTAGFQLIGVFNGASWVTFLLPNFNGTAFITGAQLVDDAVTLAKMAAITRGSIIVGDSSGNPSYIAVGAANTVFTTNGTDPAWAKVTLAMMADAAANSILVRDANTSGALSAKVLTDAMILINNGNGFTGAVLSGDASMNNAGVVKSLIEEVHSITIDGSNAAFLGDYIYPMDFNGTVTEVFLISDGTIAADSLTAEPKNDAGTSMVAAPLALISGSTIGDNVSTTALSNNTFVDGDMLIFTVAKVTPGATAKGRIVFHTIRT